MDKLSRCIHWDAAFLFALPFWMLAIPLKWLFAAFFAATIHELGHLTAVWLCKANVTAVQVGIGGARITTEPMEAAPQLFCILSGPLFSFLLLLLAPVFPRAAVCGLLHGIFNLLPLPGLDGGNALRSLMHSR